jgi:hypothetical protein
MNVKFLQILTLASDSLQGNDCYLLREYETYEYLPWEAHIFNTKAGGNVEIRLRGFTNERNVSLTVEQWKNLSRYFAKCPNSFRGL